MNLFEFANEMSKKLNENNHKEGWEGLSHKWIINRIKQETMELENAIKKGKESKEIIRECADIANFAYMLADNEQTKLEAENER